MSPSQSHLDERRQANESHQDFHKQPGLIEKRPPNSINIRQKTKYGGSKATG